MVIDRQQRIHRAGDRDQRLLDVAGRGEVGHVRADVRERAPLRVVVGSRCRSRRCCTPGSSRFCHWHSRHFPERVRVVSPRERDVKPAGIAGNTMSGGVARRDDVLRRGAGRIERRAVVGPVEDGGRQIGEDVRALPRRRTCLPSRRRRRTPWAPSRVRGEPGSRRSTCPPRTCTSPACRTPTSRLPGRSHPP